MENVLFISEALWFIAASKSAWLRREGTLMLPYLHIPIVYFILLPALHTLYIFTFTSFTFPSIPHIITSWQGTPKYDFHENSPLSSSLSLSTYTNSNESCYFLHLDKGEAKRGFRVYGKNMLKYLWHKWKLFFRINSIISKFSSFIMTFFSPTTLLLFLTCNFDYKFLHIGKVIESD